jgi:Alginate lyase
VRLRTWAAVTAVGVLLAPASAAVAGQVDRATGIRPAAPTAFKHPGVLVTRSQLDVVRQKVTAGAQPWKSAYDKMRTSPYASLTRPAKPRADVDCGSRSVPNLGCSEERDDALAAYTDALMWYISRDGRYADKAIELMDAWSGTIKRHTNSNAPLQTCWSGASWSRAAELIRYTYPAGWPKSGRFASMLRTVYLPIVIKGSGANGNWESIMTDAAIGIAVFLDDKASYDRAVALWRGRVPAYIYLKSDGATPKSPPAHPKSGSALVEYWYGQKTYVDGLAQETCRDFGHTGWGLEGAAQVAETARIQGLDLYGEMRDRMTRALEFHAGYDLGAPVPAWLCGGKINRGLGPVLEVAYNHYHNRLGLALPKTQQLIERHRPMGDDGHFVAWETLTGANNP